MDRRLAAILVADVVGFSRLMEADETGTIAALRQRRTEVLEPVLKDHRGRIVKLMGDGVLVEFASAVNAVAAAIELQKRMAVANEGLPEDRHVVLRIGLNLGDVVGAGADIYGDGVNIAARLEPLAEPGGICVSGKIYQEVLGKTTALFEDMGEQTLKNIVATVRVYRLRQGVRPAPSQASSSPSLAAPPMRDASKPSVAVLPFDNMSGDPEQEYFSDGITEDIITAISRFRSLFVIARNSSFAFRGQSLTIPEIARRLGVEYVVEGSVRRSGNRVRITAQLIEAASGNHVWSERYDRSLDDIFAVQEEVASVVASTLTGQVEKDVASQASRKRPGSFLAYDYFLRATELFQKYTENDMREAQTLLERALGVDPDYAEAYGWLALCHCERWSYNLESAQLDTAERLVRKALSLDESNARSQVILGYCNLLKRRFDQAEIHHIRALRLNPNDAHLHIHMGLFLLYTSRASESTVCFKRGLVLNPFPTSWYAQSMGIAAYVNRNYEATVNTFGSPTDYSMDRVYLAASLGQLGRVAEARAALDECARLKPDIPVIKFAEAEPYKNRADTEHLIDGLRKAGLDV